MDSRDERAIHEMSVKIAAHIQRAKDPMKALDRLLNDSGPLPDADDRAGWEKWLAETED
jgi:hypothetical protein